MKVFAYPTPGFVHKKECSKNIQWVNSFKVFVSYAYGERGSFPYLVIGKPFLGFPEVVCTETYLHIGPFSSEDVCNNVKKGLPAFTKIMDVFLP